jgi:hypothetical protein
VPKEKFAALADYTTNPLFSDLERSVIRYAEEMTEKVQVDSRLVEELKKQLGPDALVQLTLSIAAANFTNRFNEALGTELETLSRGDPMSKLNEKVALITGGSRGIGRWRKGCRDPGGRCRRRGCQGRGREGRRDLRPT